MGGENPSAEVAFGNRNCLPRAKGDVIEHSAVFAQSDFALGAAIKIVEDNFREAAMRQTAEVVDINDPRRGQ